MDKSTPFIRNTINAYYYRPDGMSMGEFCKISRIKVYQLERMLELYGQKLMPVLVDFAERNRAIYCRESSECLETLWKESSRLIAVEIFDGEKDRLRKKYHSSLEREIEHVRFRLLIDIAMMPCSEETYAIMRKVHAEVLDGYPY